MKIFAKNIVNFNDVSLFPNIDCFIVNDLQLDLEVNAITSNQLS